MKVSWVFSAVDKASRVMGKIMRTERKMASATRTGAQKSERATNRTARAFDRVKRAARGAQNVGRATFNTIINGARASGRAVASLYRQTVRLRKKGLETLGSGWARAKSGLLAGVTAATIAYGAAAATAGALVGTASDFERFQTILMTTEGSAEAAKTAMGWVSNFAVKTPYELDQVTGAFVQLRAYGLDPTQGLLQSLGDTSAAMGKPLMQAVEAIADAVTGENERLKEFGIKASKTGKVIAYEYTNAAGKTVRATVEAGNRLAIQQTLMRIMNEKYAGSMDRLSKTWGGMVSNVSDLWTKFQMMIMDAGLFDWMKGKLSEVLETINKMEADGSLLEWATKIGNTIQAALMSAWELGKGIAQVIGTVTHYMSLAASYVDGWSNLAMILGGLAFAKPLIGTALGLVQITTAITMLSAALLANPIVLAIAAIAGGAFLIYKNWGKIGPFFKKLWSGVKSRTKAVWQFLKSLFRWSPERSIQERWTGLKSAIGSKLEAGKENARKVWAAIKSLFNWSPKDALAKAWKGVKFALANPIEVGLTLLETYWAGVKTLFEWSPVGIIIKNWEKISQLMSGPVETGKMLVSHAWDSIKRIFDWSPSHVISEKWTALTHLFSVPVINGKKLLLDAWGGVKAVFNWSPSEVIAKGWSAISHLLAAPVNVGKDLVTEAWEGVKAIFSGDWLPDLSAWDVNIAGLDAINWNKLISLVGIKTSWNAVNSWFADAAAGIWDAIPDMPDWLKDAFAILERKPEVDFDKITRQSVASHGGLDRSELSAKQLETIKRLEAWRARTHGAPAQLVEDPKSLLAAAEAAQRLERQFPKLSAAAEATLDGVTVSIKSISALLSHTSFVDQGVALMRTLAGGIRSGTHLVVDEMRTAVQQVRDHLPSSPAKVGPLSDIHKLKFGETIAASIRAEPMVKAMRAAAAATMVSASSVPASAAFSPLPSASEARSAQSPSSIAKSGDTGSREGRTINVSYGDIVIGQGNAETLQSFKKELQKHRRFIKSLVDGESARNRRKGF